MLNRIPFFITYFFGNDAKANTNAMANKKPIGMSLVAEPTARPIIVAAT